MTSTSGGEAYSTAGLSPPNHSNNFTNWAGWDWSVDKINATSFGIYMYEIDASLSAKSSVGVTFSSLPQGTFVIAYGQNSSRNAYGTPFTEAGLTANSGGTSPLFGVAPAPPSVVLFGLGGLALVGFMARSRHRLLVAA